MEQETKKCPYCGEEILAVAKKCKHCGEWLNNDESHNDEKAMIPCPVCGEMIEEELSECPHCHESLVNVVSNESTNKGNIPNMGKTTEARSFFDYYFVEPFIKHYARFRGRINRKHFWISMLIWCGISILLFLIFVFFGHNKSNGIVVIFYALIALIWFVGSIIPIWATTLRRMRDGDPYLSYWGWWFYIIPSPFLLWWLVKPSDDVRYDDLAPDETPNITFMKSDKIALTIILIVLIGGLCLSFSGGSNEESNKTKIEQVANTKEVEPVDVKIRDPFVENQSDKTNIKAIIINDEGTIVSFQFVSDLDESWITIDENTYIEANHKRYKMIAAEGIPISPETLDGLSAGQVVTFYLTFPPIPKDTEVLNIYEDSETGWHWMGVHLNRNK